MLSFLLNVRERGRRDVKLILIKQGSGGVRISFIYPMSSINTIIVISDRLIMHNMLILNDQLKHALLISSVKSFIITTHS